jgi:hypothetical protein
LPQPGQQGSGQQAPGQAQPGQQASEPGSQPSAFQPGRQAPGAPTGLPQPRPQEPAAESQANAPQQGLGSRQNGLPQPRQQAPAGSRPNAFQPVPQEPDGPAQPEQRPQVDGPAQQAPGSQPNAFQPDQQAPESQPGQQASQPNAFPSGRLPATGRPATAPSALPARRPTAPAPEAETPAPREEESAVEATAEWNFGTDDGWRAVQAVSQSTPAAFTSAGLPRRRRGEQLLPGSAGPPTGATAPRPQRDAHDVRGRLRSFQQGIERGRHRTARATETNHETLEGE